MDTHKPRPRIVAAEITATPEYEAWVEEREQLVREAAPIYKAMLCSIPFYKGRQHDDAFWRHFIGSAVTAARTLVAKSKAEKL